MTKSRMGKELREKEREAWLEQKGSGGEKRMKEKRSQVAAGCIQHKTLAYDKLNLLLTPTAMG